MRIQHNVTALNAYRNYTNNNSMLSSNLEKLSSGYKINRAGDDAAGLAVSQKMRLQIAGLEQSQKNAKSGISYVQTAEGALQEVHDMLERMYTLAEQSANGTYDDTTDRVQLQKEVTQLMDEIDRIGQTSNFNGLGIFTEYVEPSNSSGTSVTLTASDGVRVALQWDDGVEAGILGAAANALTENLDETAVTAGNPALSGLTGSYTLGGTTYDVTLDSVSFDTGASDATVELTGSVTVTLDSGGTYTISNLKLGEFTYDTTELSDAGDTVFALSAQNDGKVNFWIGPDYFASQGTDQSNKLGVDAMHLDTSGLISINNSSIASSNLRGAVDISNADNAMASLSAIKEASNAVSDMRGTLGGVQNRLDHTINNLSVMEENMTEAESVIRDTDIAEEMMSYTKNSILVQSAQAMLAQANQLPQGVLQLLQ